MSDNGGTTDADYRWQWLATIWALAFGLGFPTWALILRPLLDHYPPSAPIMASLLLAWGGTVGYIIGPENIKAWRDLRGSSK